MFGFNNNDLNDRIAELEKDIAVKERGIRTFQRIINAIPAGTITIEAESAEIVYHNQRSKDFMAEIGHPLATLSDKEIRGKHINEFIDGAYLSTQMLADTDHMPLEFEAPFQNDFLLIEVTDLPAGGNGRNRRLLTWRISTEQAKLREKTSRLTHMVNTMPNSVMMADPQSVQVTYVNEAAKSIIQALSGSIPIGVDAIVGADLGQVILDSDIAGIIKTGHGLPLSRRLQYGNQWTQVKISKVLDDQGQYIAAMINLEIITDQVHVEQTVVETVELIKRDSVVLNDQSQSMSEAATANLNTASSVTLAAQDATSNVETMAAATEELGASVQEIGAQISRASDISSRADQLTQNASVKVDKLSDASQKIGDVVKLITDIAEQTNLLALNATIEAARAGEAGKGFAVVASEVKSLANQTARATEEISTQITEIQGETNEVVSAMDEISGVIGEVNEIASGIAASAEQQSAATNEIARNAQEAAMGTNNVSRHISEVQVAADTTQTGVAQVLSVSTTLTELADKLKSQMDHLVQD